MSPGQVPTWRASAQTTIPVPRILALHAPHLGTLDPYGIWFIVRRFLGLQGRVEICVARNLSTQEVGRAPGLVLCGFPTLGIQNKGLVDDDDGSPAA